MHHVQPHVIPSTFPPTEVELRQDLLQGVQCSVVLLRGHSVAVNYVIWQRRDSVRLADRLYARTTIKSWARLPYSTKVWPLLYAAALCRSFSGCWSSSASLPLTSRL